MYDMQQVFAAMAANQQLATIAGGILLLSAYVQMGEAVRLGFAHRSHAVPLFPLMFFFAHDVTYLALYDYWFEIVRHPGFEMNYWTFIPYPIAQAIILYQVIRYSRHDLFPGASLGQSILILAALQAATFVAFWWLRAQIGDPLFLVVGVMTQILSHAFNIPMLLRRGSRKGQSLLYAGNVLVGAGITTFFFAFPLFDPIFRTPLHYALGVAVVGLGVAYLWLLARTPVYVPARASD
jgi:hypothetical protein